VFIALADQQRDDGRAEEQRGDPNVTSSAVQDPIRLYTRIGVIDKT
jgi:hypothetical protein